MARFAGQAALVTGCGSGIGRGVARRLAYEGAHVAVNDVVPERATELAEEIVVAGGQAIAVPGDISVERDVASMVGAASAESGALDVLINNAAAFVFGRVEETACEAWDTVFAVNVRGTALVCKHAIPYLARGTGAAVVNISSVGGLAGSDGMTPYNTSKTALLGLTRCLAVELAPKGIRVNAVCPGCIWTPALERVLASAGLDRTTGEKAWGAAMLIKRWGTVEEVAAATAFLASDEAGYITGTYLVVDGGITVQ